MAGNIRYRQNLSGDENEELAVNELRLTGLVFISSSGSGNISFGIIISRAVVIFSGISISEELVGQMFSQSKPFLTFKCKPFPFALNNFVIYSAPKFCCGIDTVLPFKVILKSLSIIYDDCFCPKNKIRDKM